MQEFDKKLLKKLYIPTANSKKGENGKVLIIAGSDLFHSPAFWAFEIASKIVDIVFFASTPLNNEVLKGLKGKFINGILVPRGRVYDYIDEADSILLGPGLPRDEGLEEGEESTKVITETLLSKFPQKKWVVDGGSLQVIEPEILPENCIITPNRKEFEKLFDLRLKINDLRRNEEMILKMANKFNNTILLKGPVDIISNGKQTIQISGGNAGMTKGGTGDILAGLLTSFYAKNDAFLSASCASYINKKAGESLGKRTGIYFNASELASEIPKVMKELVIDKAN
jgi:hydroxyethylthiazole kinase-like uncharacterized protein yjeF